MLEFFRQPHPDLPMRVLGVRCAEGYGTLPDHSAIHEQTPSGSEQCNLREQLLACGRDCGRSCGLNTSYSPVQTVQRA